jgi:hypothetical protein
MNKEFNEVMDRITAFLRPVVLSIKDKTKDNQTWDTVIGQWKK